MYRLHPVDFDRVLELIIPIMQKKEQSTSIPPIIKLAVTLRFLAGAIFLDLSFGYDIDDNNIHRVIFEVIKSIDACVDPFLDNIIFPRESR